MKRTIGTIRHGIITNAGCEIYIVQNSKFVYVFELYDKVT